MLRKNLCCKSFSSITQPKSIRGQFFFFYILMDVPNLLLSCTFHDVLDSCISESMAWGEGSSAGFSQKNLFYGFGYYSRI